MQLKRLHLIYFRNYQQQDIVFDAQTTVLLGENGVGKTNILEAIHLLATGESFRAQKIEEMILFGAEVAHVAGLVEHEGHETKVQVRLTRGMVQGKRVQKRAFLVNEVPRLKKDFVGNVLAVTFLPEDLRLIEGSPSRRRSFLDTVLVQADREYARSLGSYEKALKRRNKLLSLIKDGKAQRTALTFYDGVLIKDGNVITNRRRELIEFLNAHLTNNFSLRIEYDFSPISEARLAQYEYQEVAVGHTLVGPHKDDLLFFKSNGSERNLSQFGSRGEHRMAVLWLKLGEMAFLHHTLNIRPLLLLDDIFSELDHDHRELVFRLLGKQQTILTTADPHFVEGLGKDIEIVKL